jgi:hypothetical protein
MKPRIVRIDGIWHCGIRGNLLFLGIGYTPAEAFGNWNEQVAFYTHLEWMP